MKDYARRAKDLGACFASKAHEERYNRNEREREIIVVVFLGFAMIMLFVLGVVAGYQAGFEQARATMIAERIGGLLASFT